MVVPPSQSHAVELSSASHTCTATMTHYHIAQGISILTPATKTIILSHKQTHNNPSLYPINSNRIKQSIPANQPKMPVPLPTNSSTEKSTSTSSGAQTAQQVGNQATQSVASAQKTEQERESDRLYEERMEEEYAKREGGA